MNTSRDIRSFLFGNIIVIIVLFIALKLSLLSVPVFAADHSETWDITYSQSFDAPFNIGPGELTFTVSVTASGTVRFTSPTNVTTVLNIPSIGINGFSDALVLQETGMYQIVEAYTLTLTEPFTGTTQSYTRASNWQYSNAAPSVVLFQIGGGMMYIDSYTSAASPIDGIRINSITPPLCRTGENVSIEITLLRTIQQGERVTIQLGAKWHKTSSLNPTLDTEDPVIEHSRVYTAQVGDPMTARVTDNLKVASVFLNFTDSLNRSFHVEMKLTSDPDTYRGYVPINAKGGEGKYYIEARDLAGNQAEFPPSSIPYPITVVSIIFGDVDNDSLVRANDATLVLRNAVGLEEFTSQQQLAGDVSGNRARSSYDSALIKQYVAGLLTTFPVEVNGWINSGMLVSAVGVSIPTDLTGDPGSSITVPVNINSTTGQGIVGVDIVLTFNSNILTATGITTAGTIASGWETAYKTASGQITIGMANPTELNGAGALAQVNFSVSGTAINGQTSPITFSSLSLNEGGVSATKTNGVFTVSGRTELQLYPGWNLISICRNIADTSLSSVLGQINGLYRSVWSYDSGIWRRYVPNGPAELNNLTNIVPGKGYWIDMNVSGSLTISGAPITNTLITLLPGWNLAGYNSLTPQSPQTALAGILEPGTSIWTYDSSVAGGAWLRHLVDSFNFYNNLNPMEPGKGYWIYVGRSFNWTVSP